MEKFQVAIIGGGIVGSCLFSELARSGASVVLLEGTDDVAGGATKANSGIIHSGYDPAPGTLMARFNVEGNAMYPEMCTRLGAEFSINGTLTVAPNGHVKDLEALKARGEKNGVTGLQILNREQILALEPNINGSITHALYAPSGGIVTPYLLCIALAEEGVINGGIAKLNFMVDNIIKQPDGYEVFSGEQKVFARYVVNSAGINANAINKLLQDKNYDCHYLKGEYIILDADQKNYLHRPIFALPTAISKGVLCTPTMHNLLFGPTAAECKPDDTSVQQDSLSLIKQKAAESIKFPNFRKTIKLFAGVRVKCGNDFIIERSDKNKGYYYAIGICSPGLTAAPAISKHLVEMLKEDGLITAKKEPVIRKPYLSLQNKTRSELKVLANKNPDYAKIICRCEKVSLGEIKDALNSPLLPSSIDALKRRVRPTMGRCQGSFCTPYLIEEIAKARGLSLESVTQKGTGSELLCENIKAGGLYEN